MASVQLQESRKAATAGQGDANIRRQGGQACPLLDHCLGLPSLIDVLDHSDEEERRTHIIMRPRYAEQNPYRMPVLAEVAFLHAEGGEFAGEHPPDRTRGRRPDRRGG